MSDIEDVGESPLNAKRETHWKEGVSANPEGRPVGKKNLKRRSRMRQTLTHLYGLQADCIEIIKLSLKPSAKEEDQIDKTRLETAKFVIKAIESFNNTCLKEELAIINLEGKNQASADEVKENQAETPAATNFSMDMDVVKSNLKH